ncbi:MAG: DMT family transporter [Clostridia bacterium]|nr:DMT family transporter [Clostridia bacterium]
MKTNLSKLKFITSMVIFGTIGLFVRMIPFPSSVISMCRGLFGAAFLIIFIFLSKKEFSFLSVKKNLSYLVLSGGLIGFNWILLFESYKYTTIAKATLCYYMAPIFIIIISPFVFGEKITLKKAGCVLASFVGMLFVSGVFEEKKPSGGEVKGILLGIFSAVIYAVIIALNKKLKEIGSFEKTVAQLLTCGLVMFVYSFFSGNFSEIKFTAVGITVMAFVCLVHTGIAYLLYFGSMEKIKAQSIAIMSYIDPVVAVLLSAVILGEKLSPFGIIGAVLIIFSAVLA